MLADRDVPDLFSLNMSEIAEIITRNDYRIALAETGEPTEAAAEPDLSAPPPAAAPKKKSASKPKGAAAAAPVPAAPTPKPKATSAKTTSAAATTTTKRKTPPPAAADAEEQAPKRVPVEAAPPKAAAAKKNGAKPKAHASATPVQSAAKRTTVPSTTVAEVPALLNIPVSGLNLEIANNFLRKIVDPKFKKFVAQVEEARQECASLVEDEYSLRDWFTVLEKQLKEPEKHQTLINLCIVIIEAVCRNLKTDVVHFGSLEKIRQRKSSGMVEYLLNNSAYLKASLACNEVLNVLLSNLDTQCNLIGFFEYCVVAEVHIVEPIKSIFAKATLKLDATDKVKYRGEVQALIPMIAAGSQLIEEYFAKEADQGEEEAQPEAAAAEEDDADLMAAALDWD